MSTPRFKRPGMCVALMERRRESTHSSKIAACSHKALERMPPWRFMYETTDVLSVRISTCCRSSCARNSFRAKKTASSSKRFMCHRIWGSDHRPEAGIPSHTAPQPSVDASVVTTTREVTKPRVFFLTPRLKRSGLRHGARASMQPQVTAILKSRSPCCPGDSRFQP